MAEGKIATQKEAYTIGGGVKPSSDYEESRCITTNKVSLFNCMTTVTEDGRLCTVTSLSKIEPEPAKVAVTLTLICNGYADDNTMLSYTPRVNVKVVSGTLLSFNTGSGYGYYSLDDAYVGSTKNPIKIPIDYWADTLKFSVDLLRTTLSLNNKDKYTWTIEVSGTWPSSRPTPPQPVETYVRVSKTGYKRNNEWIFPFKVSGMGTIPNTGTLTVLVNGTTRKNANVGVGGAGNSMPYQGYDVWNGFADENYTSVKIEDITDWYGKNPPLSYPKPTLVNDISNL